MAELTRTSRMSGPEPIPGPDPPQTVILRKRGNRVGRDNAARGIRTIRRVRADRVREAHNYLGAGRDS